MDDLGVVADGDGLPLDGRAVKEGLWVVEVLFVEDKDKRPAPWQPTVGVSLTKAGARIELADWKRRNPREAFRLVRYRPEGSR